MYHFYSKILIQTDNKLKKIILLVFFGTLLISCCEDEIVASYRLNESERNLIPFTEYSRLNYKNQNGEKLIGLTQPKENKIAVVDSGPETCDLREYESMNNFIAFENRDFVFEIVLNKANDDLLFFEINESILDSVNSQKKFLLDCERASIYKEEYIVNVSLMGFNFENVFIFKDCNNASEIKQIVYSKERGIEFIEYDNENYLRLND